MQKEPKVIPFSFVECSKCGKQTQMGIMRRQFNEKLRIEKEEFICIKCLMQEKESGHEDINIF